jgi:hypothetical protein
MKDLAGRSRPDVGARSGLDPERNVLVDENLLKIGRVEEGELVVIIAGSPPGIPGSTNALRIHRIGDAINEVAPAYERKG